LGHWSGIDLDNEFQLMSKPDNRILLHILKHNPRDGEVYFTWEGETFCGEMNHIEVRRNIDEVTSFTISGFVRS
jgi:hypothetical protein